MSSRLSTALLLSRSATIQAAQTRGDHDLASAARRFDAVIHFAGRKAVGESVQSPMLYYTHNVVGAVNLIEACRKHNLNNVGFIIVPD